MRIFIDCTDTYRSELNTGIQRVVRNIVNHAENTGNALGVQCIPVTLGLNNYTQVKYLRYGLNKRFAFRLRAKTNNYYSKITRLIAKFVPSPKLKHFITASKHDFSLAKIIVYAISPLILAWRFVRHRPSTHESLTSFYAQPRSGDILLLLDSVWNYDFNQVASKAKDAGATIFVIIYDIIPLSHPQFVDQRNVSNFETCLPKLYDCVDGFICISNYTKETLQNYLSKQSYACNLNAKYFDFFHLGAELDVIDKRERIRTAITKPFNSGLPVYLSVGTIEPRKNHAYLLKVFDLLWTEGSHVNLVIIGRIGWLCDEVLIAIRSHPKYGIHLFFIDDATDRELEHAYLNAKALLFPAIVEGFGLPLIEAQMKGLPVFASDIPVFREVAGSSAAYFDNTDPKILASMLKEYERSGIFPADGPASFTWLNWPQSTEQLLTRVLAQYSLKQKQELSTDNPAGERNFPAEHF